MTQFSTKLSMGIISRDGMRDAAARIADAAAEVADETLVIYSNHAGAPETGAGTWVSTPQSDYFGRKFRTLLRRMRHGNALLLVQADAVSADWRNLALRFRSVLEADSTLGLWSPSIDNTGFPGALAIAGPRSDSLVPVIQTDAVVLGIHPDVLSRLGALDYERNNLGWGIDWAAAGFCIVNGRAMLQDLAQQVHHPTARGYDGDEALAQMSAFLRQLTPPEIAAISRAQAVIAANSAKFSAKASDEMDNIAQIGTPPEFDGTDAPIVARHLSFLAIQPGRVVFAPLDPERGGAFRLGGAAESTPPQPVTRNAPRVLAFNLP